MRRTEGGRRMREGFRERGLFAAAFESWMQRAGLLDLRRAVGERLACENYRMNVLRSLKFVRLGCVFWRLYSDPYVLYVDSQHLLSSFHDSSILTNLFEVSDL